MPKLHLKIVTVAAILMTFLVAASPSAAPQSVTAVQKLDPDRFIGTYYEIARYPIKREKTCVGNEMVLYALGDKRNTFQVVTACQIKQDNSDFWNNKGKLGDSANGRFKLAGFWPFTLKYWVLAVAPDYSWALVGNPNHRSLWILSRTATLSPGVLAAIEASAAAQGFNTAKLIQIPQP